MHNRRVERIPILGDLQGEVTVFERMAIREISVCGALVETSVPLQLNSLHQCRLALGDCSVVVRGRVAHSHVSEVAQSGTIYTSGIEFIDVPDAVAAVISQFVEALRAAREEGV